MSSQEEVAEGTNGSDVSYGEHLQVLAELISIREQVAQKDEEIRRLKDLLNKVYHATASAWGDLEQMIKTTKEGLSDTIRPVFAYLEPPVTDTKAEEALISDTQPIQNDLNQPLATNEEDNTARKNENKPKEEEKDIMGALASKVVRKGRNPSIDHDITGAVPSKTVVRKERNPSVDKDIMGAVASKTVRFRRKLAEESIVRPRASQTAGQGRKPAEEVVPRPTAYGVKKLIRRPVEEVLKPRASQTAGQGRKPAEVGVPRPTANGVKKLIRRPVEEVLKPRASQIARPGRKEEEIVRPRASPAIIKIPVAVPVPSEVVKTGSNSKFT